MHLRVEPIFAKCADEISQPDSERMQQLFLSLQEEVEKENSQTLDDLPDNSSEAG